MVFLHVLIAGLLAMCAAVTAWLMGHSALAILGTYVVAGGVGVFASALCVALLHRARRWVCDHDDVALVARSWRR